MVVVKWTPGHASSGWCLRQLDPVSLQGPRFPSPSPTPFPLSPAPLAPTFPQVPKAQASPPGDLSEPYTPLIPSMPLHWQQNSMDTDSNTVENGINGVGVAILEVMPCLSDSSNLWNVKTGQNNLWTGLQATLCPKPLFAKTKQQIIVTIGLKTNNTV